MHGTQGTFSGAVSPLTHILEEAAKGELTQNTALEAAHTALKLLGNASVHVSRERKKNALQNMNSWLLDMADDDIVFKSAALALFGEGFCKRANERDEEFKCLYQAIYSKSISNTQVKQEATFFQEATPREVIPMGVAKITGDRGKELTRETTHTEQTGSETQTIRKRLILYKGNKASTSNVYNNESKIFSKPYAKPGYTKSDPNGHKKHVVTNHTFIVK